MGCSTEVGRGASLCGCQREDPGRAWGARQRAAESRGPCEEPPVGGLVQALGAPVGGPRSVHGILLGVSMDVKRSRIPGKTVGAVRGKVTFICGLLREESLSMVFQNSFGHFWVEF